MEGSPRCSKWLRCINSFNPCNNHKVLSFDPHFTRWENWDKKQVNHFNFACLKCREARNSNQDAQVSELPWFSTSEDHWSQPSADKGKALILSTALGDAWCSLQTNELGLRAGFCAISEHGNLLNLSRAPYFHL